MANIQNNNYNLPAENFFGDTASNYTLIVRSQRQIDELKESIDSPFVKEIRTKDDFPTPTNGVITLEDNVTYLIVTDVDLQGDRIECGQNNVITGWSSENCSLTSTGLNPLFPLVYSEYTVVIKFITLKDVGTCFEIEGSGNMTALDWMAMNVVNVNNIGRFIMVNNLILTNCAFFNANNMVLEDSFDSFVMSTCLMSSTTSGTLISTLPTTVCNRRIRIQDSAIILIGNSNGFNLDPATSIADEAYILNTVNFTNIGSGNTLVGTDYTSNKAEFSGCTGIINSAKFANYYALNNTTVTPIPGANIPVKANVVTFSNPISQKFTFTDNRATYTGGVRGFFKALTTLSLTANSNNDQISIYIAKNGSIINQSKITTTSDRNNRLQNVVAFTPVELDPNDYIEVWVENNSDGSNIRITSCNVMIETLTIA